MPRILIVEDHADVQIVLSYFLQHLGCEITLADDGRAGLRMATEQRPDMILSDINLPQMSGAELATRLARDPQTSAIPVLLFSGTGIDTVAVNGRVEAVIQKPFNLAALTQEIAEALRQVGIPFQPPEDLFTATAAADPL